MATISQVQIGDKIYRLRDAEISYATANSWILQTILISDSSYVQTVSESQGTGVWKAVSSMSISNLTPNGKSVNAVNYTELNSNIPNCFFIGSGLLEWVNKVNFINYRGIRFNYNTGTDLNQLNSNRDTNNVLNHQNYISGYGNTSLAKPNDYYQYQSICACAHINEKNWEYLPEDENNIKTIYPTLWAWQDSGSNINVHGMFSLAIFSLGGHYCFNNYNKETKLYENTFIINRNVF